jgi:hypothetical protein
MSDSTEWGRSASPGEAGDRAERGDPLGSRFEPDVAPLGGSGVPSGSEESMRASDADRERFAERLKEHYANGRLPYEELERRLGRVYQAVTLIELYGLTSDLPHPGSIVTGPLARTPRERRSSGPLARFLRRASGTKGE